MNRLRITCTIYDPEVDPLDEAEPRVEFDVQVPTYTDQFLAEILRLAASHVEREWERANP